ncbi:Transposon TX1 uncharacterized 149 kDa protein [Eumeta japonica]|uniref:Transposon TX1 uncharacterized 149 kDa protein n=1 Tax=Eumeta variegata TaxID=151549 RepID=A0A4C1VNK1_EUMVA|nr:Transposon TX1 uncharacterized 149 kDa protein [Eumeta japonica]
MVKKVRNNFERSCLHVIRDDDGHLLKEENNVKERWKNYFENVFACEDTVADDDVTATEYMIDDRNESEITIDEIMKALKYLKVGQAAGYDRVSSEMLRGGRVKVASLLYQLFNKCCKNHRVNNDWCKAVIVLLYKGKGSRQVCTNYRPISLLGVVGKLYAKIFVKRVVNETENKIWDLLAGFRKGMGCTDHFFFLRNIVEKVSASGQNVFCIFIDLGKVYDRLKRNYLPRTLSMYGVNSGLIQALQYRGSSACVRINGTNNVWFDMRRVVRQGCVASLWLFNLFMDSFLHDLKEYECRLRMDELSVKCLLYANEQVVLAPSACGLQEMESSGSEDQQLTPQKENCEVPADESTASPSQKSCDNFTTPNVSEDAIQKADSSPEANNEDWQQREIELLKKIEELEKVKTEAGSDGVKIELKIRTDECELLRARIKSLETELAVALSRPGANNKELVERIKQQHDDLLTKARGMIFDKTKIVKNQELQIAALTSQVASLKDVNTITKDLLEIRNAELKNLERIMIMRDHEIMKSRERQLRFRGCVNVWYMLARWTEPKRAERIRADPTVSLERFIVTS